MTCVVFNEMCNVFVLSSHFESSPGRKKPQFFFFLTPPPLDRYIIGHKGILVETTCEP